MKNIARIALILSYFIISTPSFATEASDATTASCTCKKNEDAVTCQLYPFPNHLEGVVFQAVDCKEADKKDTYQCSNQFLNFADGSSLASVTCSLFDGKSKLTKELDANPVLSYVQKLVSAIMNGGDSDVKRELSDESAPARAKIEAYNQRISESQAGVDAYLKAVNLNADAQRNPTNSTPPAP